MIKKFLIIIILVCIPTFAFAETWKMSLDESLDRALKENRDITIAKQRIVEFEGLKGEALAMGLPQLSATGQYQHTWQFPQITINNMPFRVGTHNQYTATVQLSQLLWSGGKVMKAYRAAKSEAAYGQENLRGVQEQVKLAVQQTYYDILYTQRVIEVLERQLKQLKDQLGSIKARYSKGVDSDYAVMRQEVAVSNIEPQLLDAKRIEELLKNSIKILLVLPQEDDFVASSPFSYLAKHIPPTDALVETAKARRPDLLAEKHRQYSLQQGVGIEKAGWFPTLSFLTNFQWQGMTDNWIPKSSERTTSTSSFINVSLPIFDGLKTYSKVKQAKAKLFQQKAAVSKLEEDVTKNVRDVFDSLQKARAAFASQQKSFDTSKRASAIANERFAAGLISQLELLDTINAQAKAEELYYRSMYDCLVGEAALTAAVGGELSGELK